MKKFDEELLLQKKARFKEAVKRASKKLKVPAPEVKFWRDKCPYGSLVEEAHIHPDVQIICVSERKLNRMTYEDIEDTASHEVTHLTDTKAETGAIHSPDFYGRHDKLKEDLWRPPGAGIAHITPNANKEQVKSEKSKINKEECNQHSCHSKINLKRCKYCRKYFCEYHINPFLPHFPTIAGGRVIRGEDQEGGHPCTCHPKLKQEEPEPNEPNIVVRHPHVPPYKKKNDKILPIEDKTSPMSEEKVRELTKSRLGIPKKCEPDQIDYISHEEIKPKKEKPEISEEKPKYSKGAYALIALIILLILGALFYYFTNINPLAGIIINESESLVEPPAIVEEISFANYLKNFKDYENQDIELKGYIVLNVKEGGVILYQLSDDDNNRITLNGLSSLQKKMFSPIKSMSQFEVVGTLRTSTQGIMINVKEFNRV